MSLGQLDGFPQVLRERKRLLLLILRDLFAQILHRLHLAVHLSLPACLTCSLGVMGVGHHLTVNTCVLGIVSMPWSPGCRPSDPPRPSGRHPQALRPLD